MVVILTGLVLAASLVMESEVYVRKGDASVSNASVCFLKCVLVLCASSSIGNRDTAIV